MSGTRLVCIWYGFYASGTHSVCTCSLSATHVVYNIRVWYTQSYAPGMHWVHTQYAFGTRMVRYWYAFWYAWYVFGTPGTLCLERILFLWNTCCGSKWYSWYTWYAYFCRTHVVSQRCANSVVHRWYTLVRTVRIAVHHASEYHAYQAWHTCYALVRTKQFADGRQMAHEFKNDRTCYPGCILAADGRTNDPADKN